MVRIRYFIVFLSIIFLIGCGTSYYAQDASHVPAIKRIKDPQFPEFKPPKTEEGSLWSETWGIDLYPDKRARKVEILSL